MKILILEPYYTGSHKQWAEGYKKYSNHEIEILSMKGQFWKWRMHGGAVTLAKQFNNLDYKPDLILSTDMLDFSTFWDSQKQNLVLLSIFMRISFHTHGLLTIEM